MGVKYFGSLTYNSLFTKILLPRKINLNHLCEEAANCIIPKTITDSKKLPGKLRLWYLPGYVINFFESSIVYFKIHDSKGLYIGLFKA